MDIQCYNRNWNTRSCVKKCEFYDECFRRYLKYAEIPEDRLVSIGDEIYFVVKIV